MKKSKSLPLIEGGGPFVRMVEGANLIQSVGDTETVQYQLSTDYMERKDSSHSFRMT